MDSRISWSTLATPHASQPWLAKNVYIHLPKKILYAKITYYDYPNKNVKHLDLRITKIWV